MQLAVKRQKKDVYKDAAMKGKIGKRRRRVRFQEEGREWRFCSPFQRNRRERVQGVILYYESYVKRQDR